MAQRKRILITALTLMLCGAAPASAQKQGGVLRVFFFDSPASMSIHEEATIAGQGPMMGVFNNLILYDQKVPQAGMKSIVPDLASAWTWNADGTALSTEATGQKRRTPEIGIPEPYLIAVQGCTRQSMRDSR